MGEWDLTPTLSFGLRLVIRSVSGLVCLVELILRRPTAAPQRIRSSRSVALPDIWVAKSRAGAVKVVRAVEGVSRCAVATRVGVEKTEKGVWLGSLMTTWVGLVRVGPLESPATPSRPQGRALSCPRLLAYSRPP